MSTLLSQGPDEGDGVEVINTELTVSRPPDTCPNRGVASNWLGIGRSSQEILVWL